MNNRDYEHRDLEGLCRSPHDAPPKWALMLTMYLDESLEKDDGFVVVAGFAGREANWNLCLKEWQRVRGKRGPLHMKTLRKWETARHEKHLAELAKVPEQSGLILVYAAVKYSDYKDLIEGTYAELAGEGYLLCLFMIVLSIIHGLTLSKERLEVICEQQVEYAALRESMFKLAQSMPEAINKDGLPILAKWSSIGKSTVLEPSDFAAFALLQRLKDPTGRKAVLTGSILEAERKIGIVLSREDVRKNIGKFGATEGVKRPMSKDEKRTIRAAFRQEYGDGK